MKQILLFSLLLIFLNVDAQTWQQLSGGSPDGPVTALYHDSTYLWIAGEFTHAGTLSVQNVVRHKGLNYVATPGFDGWCNQFIKFKGKLYACGRFNVGSNAYGLLRFDGTSWSPLMQIPTFPEQVYAAAIYNNKLVLGGSFTGITGLTLSKLVTFDGMNWATLIGYFNINSSIYGSSNIWTLLVDGGNLYVAGNFFGTNFTLTTPNSSAGHCLVWNGSTWSSRPMNLSDPSSIRKLIKYQNTIYAFGYIDRYFTNPFGGSSAVTVCGGVITGPPSGWTHWNCLGGGPPITARAGIDFNGKIYAGGSTNGNDYSSGNTRLWVWNGSTWTPDTHFDPPGTSLLSVFAKNPLGNNLYVGGDFSFNNGTTTIKNLAYTTTGSVLPIELSSFSGTCKNGKTELKWQTLSETNNDRFDIEYTKDGEDFVTVRSVGGKGTTETPSDYALFLEGDSSGYYRLKQVDVDSTATYSQIIFVDQCEYAKYMVYPTIASDKITITGLTKKDNCVIYDLYLRPVITTEMVGQAEVLDIERLLPGIYTIILGEGEKSKIVRFIKQ